MLRTRAVVSLAFLTLVLACRRSEPSFDFAANLDKASLTPETSRIDFGTAAARAFLLEGWSGDETWPEPETTAVWGVGTSSRLLFHHFGSGGITLTFRCIPLWFDVRPQSIRFVVNGTALERVALGTGFRTYRVSIPAAALHRGANDLRIEYAIAARPGASDGRMLAVAWDWMTFGSASSPRAAKRNGDAIVLPARTELTWLAPVAPRCSVALDRVDEPMQISIGRPEAILPVVHPIEPRRDVRIDLGVEREAFAEVDFVAGERDVTVTRPRIECAEAAGHRPTSRRDGGVPRVNVLIYLVDTLRADHLGVYGYGRPTSPRIDAFARDSVVFTNAIAQSGWTKTSVASILTGLLPFHHGTLDRDDALAPSIPTLPMMLAGAGYQRFAAVANGNVSPAFGFQRGFEPYRYFAADRRETGAVAGVLVDAWQQWLDTRRGAAPWFAYLHTIDPHDPYHAPEPYAARFGRGRIPVAAIPEIAGFMRAHRGVTIGEMRQNLIDKYDSEIVYTDAMFGRALDDLKRRGLYDQTLIIFTSDHGEEFLDHDGWGHGNSLYHELLHVPLIVKFPRGRYAGTVVTANVQHTDIAPTVLRAAGVAVPRNLDGMQLMDVAGGPERRIASYLRLDAADLMSVVYGSRQYLVRNAPPGAPPEEILRFGPTTTAAERLYLTQSDVWQRSLRRSLVLLRRQSRSLAVPQVPLEGDLARELRALGYLR